MGANTSKLEDDKALILCRERRRFVRQAVDGRCSFAEAHVTYIQSLKRIGTALKKFVEHDSAAAPESSLFSSTSATPEQLALTEKSISHFSFSSPSTSQRVDPVEVSSPTPSPPSPSHTHANYMKKRVTPSTKVEEKPSALVTATMSYPLGNSQDSKFQHHGDTSFDDPPSSQPEMPAWDYWGLFHPIDRQFSYQDGRENMEDIGRLREEEGIPNLEEDGEKSTIYQKEEEYSESEGDFDNLSSSPLVQSYRRRADVLEMYSPSESPTTSPANSSNPKTTQANGEKASIKESVDGDEEQAPKLMSSTNGSPSLSPLSNGNLPGPSKASSAENKLEQKDFLSSIKEIENLFCRASDSGKEVLRMLEATEIQYRPLHSGAKVGKPRVSMIFQACLVCFEDPERAPEGIGPPSSANEIKYLTWHRSTSSRSSSSRYPLAADSKDEAFDSGDLYRNFCMNSGSHASTLDRLYAWERKLYDEVKASGLIRRDYDQKCKLLRQQESQGESSTTVDKTRTSVKDLHSRIRVSIQRIGSISKTIEEIRDKELQPQLEELNEGLNHMWETMLNAHKLQFNIISVAYNSGNSYFSLQSESHQQLTMLLGSELNNLRSSFIKWISSQKSYVRAINSWLLKCVSPLPQKSSRRSRHEEFSPTEYLPPPVFVTCRDWLLKLDELPTRNVENGIIDLEMVTTRFLPKQDKNQNKKLNSTLSWKGEGNGEAASNLLPREAPLDWNSSFDSLQKSLITFFGQFYSFAEESFKKSVELDVSINKAKEAYENGGRKKQQ